MPKRITALEPDPNRPGAVRVLVDGRPFCTVHEGAVRAGALGVGDEWDEARSATAGRAADEEAAWRTLLKALERRSFSVGELRRRLRQKGHPAPAVDFAIERALGMTLLDDAAFALQYVQSRAHRGRGPARLRQDLRARSVAEPLIDAALRAQWPEPEAALDVAASLAARRARQLGAVDRDVKRRRLLGFLARRGFSGSRVSELVRRILNSEERSPG
ncbi:MAG TPA: regulatory protein RecX [Gemmatimonadales bacterium]|nr:regulatory protein RecX [Gemmatimonadales bacterium]